MLRNLPPCRYNHPIEERYRAESGRLRCQSCTRIQRQRLIERFGGELAYLQYIEKKRERYWRRNVEFAPLGEIHGPKRPSRQINAPPTIMLRCECGEPVLSIRKLIEHTLVQHGRGPTRAERTPRCATPSSSPSISQSETSTGS